VVPATEILSHNSAVTPLRLCKFLLVLITAIKLSVCKARVSIFKLLIEFCLVNCYNNKDMFFGYHPIVLGGDKNGI
jgi:hypothetical protein